MKPNNIDNIIKHLSSNKKENKDLIKQLNQIKQGNYNIADKDFINKINNAYPSSFSTSMSESINKVRIQQKALENATTLQTNVKDGIRNSIKNQGIPDDAINNKRWLSKNQAKAFSTEYVKNIDSINDTGAIKLKDSAISKASKKGTQKTTEKTASTAAKALRLGGALSKVFMAFDCASAAIDGGTMGYGIAAWAVESNPQNFTNADGSYDTTRANVAKALGAASGACIGFAVGMWSSGVGAAINVATGGVAGTVIGGIAAGVGVLLGAASAVTCFTKWFK